MQRLRRRIHVMEAWRRLNFITLSSEQTSSQVGSRAGLRPARELDSVMEVGLSHAILLASSSLAGRRPASELVADVLATC